MKSILALVAVISFLLSVFLYQKLWSSKQQLTSPETTLALKIVAIFMMLFVLYVLNRSTNLPPQAFLYGKF